MMIYNPIICLTSIFKNHHLINLNNIDITHYPYTILNEQEYYFAYRPPYVVKIRFNEEEFILINVTLIFN